MYYVPHSKADQQAMLESMGLSSIEDLFNDIDPSIRNPQLNMAKGIDPVQLNEKIDHMAQKNNAQNYNSFMGAGAYDHYIPAIVGTLSSRGEFLSSYTPYQPEMSQGMLQSIFEYQTMMCELTGLDVANASLYDGSTACWEAILMAVRIKRKQKILIAQPFHPLYLKVIESHAKAFGLELVLIPENEGLICESALKEHLDDQTAALLVQYPNYLGFIDRHNQTAELCAQAGALFLMAANPMSLALLKTPGELGVDICIGDAQCFGLPLSFGGPYLGYIVAKQKYLRQMPGRICGLTNDDQGRRGFVLTIQTREQHIRRDKATSNICSNQALMALRAAIYLSYMGKSGLKRVAQSCLKRSAHLKKQLQAIPGFELCYDHPSIWEFPLRTNIPGSELFEHCLKQKILPGVSLSCYKVEHQNDWLVAVTETKSLKQIEELLSCLKTIAQTHLTAKV